MAEKLTLTLENLVRAYTDLAQIDSCGDYTIRFWERVHMAFYDPQNKGTPGAMMTDAREYLSEQSHKGKIPKSVEDVILLIGQMNHQEQQDALDRLAFVNGIYSGTNIGGNNIDVFVNRVSQFKDQAVAYRAIKFIHQSTINKCSVKTQKYITYLLANNKSATQKDVLNVLRYCDTIDEARQVVNALFAMADKEIAQELQREIPDVMKLNVATSGPKSATSVIHYRNPSYLSMNLMEYLRRLPENEHAEFEEYFNVANDKYDVNKILLSNDPKYIQKFDDSIVMQIADIRAQNAEFNKQNNELKRDNARLESATNKATAEIEKLQAEIEKLQGWLATETNKFQTAEKGRKLLKSQLNALIMVAQQVRGGLGSRGVNELRDTIDRINQNEK